MGKYHKEWTKEVILGEEVLSQIEEWASQLTKAIAPKTYSHHAVAIIEEVLLEMKDIEYGFKRIPRIHYSQGEIAGIFAIHKLENQIKELKKERRLWTKRMKKSR